MTGSTLSASELSYHCPQCGKVVRGDSPACAECGADHTSAQAAGGHAAAIAGEFAESPSSTQLAERAPGSGWGPASNAALSLFVFVLIFGLAALFETSRPGKVAKPVALSSAPSVITESSARPAPQLSVATTYPKPVVQKRSSLHDALARARACSRAKSWDCVRLAASEALALDGGNTEAQGLLERSIKQSAWQSHASAVPALTTASTARDAPASSQGTTLSPGANADERQRAIARLGWAHPASAH